MDLCHPVEKVCRSVLSIFYDICNENDITCRIYSVIYVTKMTCVVTCRIYSVTYVTGTMLGLAVCKVSFFVCFFLSFQWKHSKTCGMRTTCIITCRMYSMTYVTKTMLGPVINKVSFFLSFTEVSFFPSLQRQENSCVAWYSTFLTRSCSWALLTWRAAVDLVRGPVLYR